MYRTFKASHLTREERARITQINKSLAYFQGFMGSTPASQAWASGQYWKLRNEKDCIREDAHDRCRAAAIKTACAILSEIAWKGGLGTPNDESEYPAMLRDFENVVTLLAPWGFEERGASFINHDRLTIIRLEYWPEEVKY